jgi:hypothetical protein
MVSPPPGPGQASPTLTDGFAEIERTADSAIDDLARMVASDTTFPPGAGYEAFAGLMESAVAALGLDCQRVDVPEHLWRVAGAPAQGRRTNLIARRRSDKPVLGLYFHVDTVPAAPGWTTNPFQLTRDGDRLVGLGAADMKGTIAAVLLALRAADTIGLPLGYNPMLLLCSDEEGGLYPGVRYLAEQGLLEGHILNFNGAAAPRIWAGCFGLFTLLVRVHGRTVHASEARTAGSSANAIEAALPILEALAALKPTIATRTSALPAPPVRRSRLQPSLIFPPPMAANAAGRFHRSLKFSSVGVTRRRRTFRPRVPKSRTLSLRRPPGPASTWFSPATSCRHPIRRARTGRAGRRRCRPGSDTHRTISPNGVRRAVRISAGCNRPECRRSC